MVMTASSCRSPPGTTVGVAGRRDSKTSSLAHVILAQVREANISLTTILSFSQFFEIGPLRFFLEKSGAPSLEGPNK